MKKEIIKSTRLGEEYIRIEHPTGLTILLCPMKGFSTAYAMFGTDYGSIDTCFKTNKEPDFVTVPEGIAHFLEHKLFESDDGDAFTRYAKTGAAANAFTSFDKTSYLFACSDNFKESLDILLDFVTHPYFTKETVEKEQGIIAQEIKMYDDDPGWRVYFNLLGALYSSNPVRVDIAGTVESIAKIDADLLYRCYHTFYNLHNMVLTIAGNFDVDVVLQSADRILKKAEPLTIESKISDEPYPVCNERVEISLPVAVPMFQVGFKGVSHGRQENVKNQVIDEILADLIAGETSPLYRRLYDAGLINAGFSQEVMVGRDYCCTIFAGESKDPNRVYEELKKEIDLLHKTGISQETFLRAKKGAYGRYIGMFSHVEAVANLMNMAHFAGMGMYDFLGLAADVTKEQLEARLKENLLTNRCAISIVHPQKEEQLD